MAINLMNDNIEIKCKKCGGRVFEQKKGYLLSRIDTAAGVVIRRNEAYEIYSCVMCGETEKFMNVIE